jgi:hypothetical protein
MPERASAGGEPAAARSDISTQMRDRYVAYRRAEAELRAWLKLRRDDEPAIEAQLRNREGTALDRLIKSPAASVADLAVKLEVLKDLASGETERDTSEVFKILLDDSLGLAVPDQVEGRMLALRLTLTLLLNAAAPDAESIDRTRQAVLDLIDRPDSPCAANKDMTQAAKAEVSALFSWIE